MLAERARGDQPLPKRFPLQPSLSTAGEPPVVISMPNFLFADEEVRRSVRGLEEPDVDRDIITVDIEPVRIFLSMEGFMQRLGVVLSAGRRSQVNIEMWKGKDIKFP